MADEWRLQYPSLTVSKKYRGDRELAERLYRGEAQKLLYELKKLMTFRSLGQLSMKRHLSDGTVIKAKSTFGLDTIEIDISGIIPLGAGAEWCVITFVDIPQYVQPMRNPGIIGTSEVEGIDYIKTYYFVNDASCPTCHNPTWTISFRFTDDTIAHYDIDPLEHCLISTDYLCSGEIIETGSDSDGKFFIWKVYTEGGEKTRSGYGFALILVQVRNDVGDVICDAEHTVEVDCCLREDRTGPKIYWIPWDGMPGDCLDPIGDLCRVPNVISAAKLLEYAQSFEDNKGIFYSLPSIGGCLPYTWDIHNQGMGSFLVLGANGENLEYTPPESFEIGCVANAAITVTDRCGEDPYTVSAISCCENLANPPIIVYTSLLMGCSQSQTLEVQGGCTPYTWTLLSGGGSVVSDGGLGFFATYTSPATNPNCVSNPTIEVSDCCGNTATVQLAVNCYGGPEMALQNSDIVICGNECFEISGYYYLNANWRVIRYKCNGEIYSSCQTNANCASSGGPVCGFGDTDCSFCFDGVTCYTGQCGGNPDTLCGVWDYRTVAMKNDGCCPINPATGLPY